MYILATNKKTAIFHNISYFESGSIKIKRTRIKELKVNF